MKQNTYLGWNKIWLRMRQNLLFFLGHKVNEKWTWNERELEEKVSHVHSRSWTKKLEKIWARNEPRSWVNWNERRSRSFLPISAYHYACLKRRNRNKKNPKDAFFNKNSVYFNFIFDNAQPLATEIETQMVKARNL